MKKFYEYCSKFPKIIIYGAGDVGRMAAEFMEKENIPLAGFCVTGKPEKRIWGKYEITDIHELIDSGVNAGIIVAVSKKNADGILELLQKQKLSYFYCAEFLYQLFKRKCQEYASKVMIHEGYLRRISEVPFKRNTLYLCCPASIGDTLYAAALVRTYKENNKSVSRVCLILKKGHEEIGKMFAAVDEVLVSDEIVEILDCYSMYTQIWRLNNYIYGHFKKSNRFVYDKEYDRKGCDAILPRYCGLIMNLPSDAKLEKISLKSETRQKKGKENEAVIMPYARTARMLPDSFWEDTAGRLKEKGYFVYTNIGNEKEKVVPGTKALRKSLMETALFCEKCSVVIALRSGICDLLGFTETNLVVLNTSEELFSEWNLKDVFRRERINNINCFECRNYSEKIDEIMRIVG